MPGRCTCIVWDGLLQAKVFVGNLAGVDGGGVLGRRSPRWGRHLWSSIPTAQGSQGENLVQLWTSDESASSIVPSSEASSLETQLSCGITDNDGSWEATFDGSARRHGAGCLGSWGC